jgi:hypothetical protein
MFGRSEIHREAAIKLGEEWVSAKAQKLPQAACLDSQGIPSEGFKKLAMKLIPEDHPYYKEVGSMQFDGTMCILGSIACGSVVGALICCFAK